MTETMAVSIGRGDRNMSRVLDAQQNTECTNLREAFTPQISSHFPELSFPLLIHAFRESTHVFTGHLFKK